MSSVAPPEVFEDTSEGVIVFFFLWISALIASSQISDDLTEEARIGTLEQVVMSRFDITTITVFKALSLFVQNLLIIVPVLVLMMATTGRWLHIDVLSLIPLFLLTIMSAWGIGFMLAGLAIIFKRITAIFQLVQWFFLGCAAAASNYALAIYLPIAMGTRLIGDVMVKGLPIYALPFQSIMILVANGVVYFASGCLIFKLCIKVAKNKGLLGQY